MRPILFALSFLSATACPAFASGTSIEARSSTFGCQFSAALDLFSEFSTMSQEDTNRILDTGHCLPIEAHQAFTVRRELPSAYVALRDTQQDNQWIVLFVRKSDFDMSNRTSDHKSAGKRHGAAMRTEARGGSPQPRTGAASTRPGTTVETAHHPRIATGETPATAH
jgi:hypothetical protein